MEIIQSLIDLNSSISPSVDSHQFQAILDDFERLSKKIVNLQQETKNHYEIQNEQSLSIFPEIMKFHNNLTSNIENLLENCSLQDIDSDILLNISNMMESLSDEKVNLMIYTDNAESSEKSLYSVSSIADNEANIGEWIKSSIKLLKESNFDTIDDLVLNIKESNELLEWDINEDIEKVLMGSEIPIENLNIIDNYRNQREFVHQYHNDLILKLMKYNDCIATVQKSYQEVGHTSLLTDPEEIKQRIDLCIIKRDNIQELANNLKNSADIHEVPQILSTLLSQLQVEIDGLENSLLSTSIPSNQIRPSGNVLPVGATEKPLQINAVDVTFEDLLQENQKNTKNLLTKDCGEIPRKKRKTHGPIDNDFNLILPETINSVELKTKIEDYEIQLNDNQNNAEYQKEDIEMSQLSSIDSNDSNDSNNETESICIDSNVSDDEIDDRLMLMNQPISSSNKLLKPGSEDEDLYFTPFQTVEDSIFPVAKEEMLHSKNLLKDNSNNNAVEIDDRNLDPNLLENIVPNEYSIENNKNKTHQLSDERDAEIFILDEKLKCKPEDLVEELETTYQITNNDKSQGNVSLGKQVDNNNMKQEIDRKKDKTANMDISNETLSIKTQVDKENIDQEDLLECQIINLESNVTDFSFPLADDKNQEEPIYKTDHRKSIPTGNIKYLSFSDIEMTDEDLKDFENYSFSRQNEQITCENIEDEIIPKGLKAKVDEKPKEKVDMDHIIPTMLDLSDKYFAKNKELDPDIEICERNLSPVIANNKNKSDRHALEVMDDPKNLVKKRTSVSDSFENDFEKNGLKDCKEAENLTSPGSVVYNKEIADGLYEDGEKGDDWNKIEITEDEIIKTSNSNVERGHKGSDLCLEYLLPNEIDVEIPLSSNINEEPQDHKEDSISESTRLKDSEKNFEFNKMNKDYIKEKSEFQDKDISKQETNQLSTSIQHLKDSEDDENDENLNNSISSLNKMLLDSDKKILTTPKERFEDKDEKNIDFRNENLDKDLNVKDNFQDHLELINTRNEEFGHTKDENLETKSNKTNDECLSHKEKDSQQTMESPNKRPELEEDIEPKILSDAKTERNHLNERDLLDLLNDFPALDDINLIDANINDNIRKSEISDDLAINLGKDNMTTESINDVKSVKDFPLIDDITNDCTNSVLHQDESITSKYLSRNRAGDIVDFEKNISSDLAKLENKDDFLNELETMEYPIEIIHGNNVRKPVTEALVNRNEILENKISEVFSNDDTTTQTLTTGVVDILENIPYSTDNEASKNQNVLTKDIRDTSSILEPCKFKIQQEDIDSIANKEDINQRMVKANNANVQESAENVLITSQMSDKPETPTENKENSEVFGSNNNALYDESIYESNGIDMKKDSLLQSRSQDIDDVIDPSLPSFNQSDFKEATDTVPNKYLPLSENLVRVVTTSDDEEQMTNKQQMEEKSISYILPDTKYPTSDLIENVLQKARDTIERISSRKKNNEKIMEDDQVMISLNDLEDWIDQTNDKLNSLHSIMYNELPDLKDKETKLNEIIEEIGWKTSDLDSLEVALEKHSDNVNAALSDSLRSRFCILRTGVNSIKLLTHNHLADILIALKNKEKENINKKEAESDVKLIDQLTKLPIILNDVIDQKKPNQYHETISNQLSFDFANYQNLLENIITDAETINIIPDSNTDSQKIDFQQQRVMWQLLLTRCKTRLAQIKDQCTSRLSKRFSPSFFVLTNDRKDDPLLQIKEGIEKLLLSSTDISSHEIYGLMKSIESATQVIENRIINSQLSSGEDCTNDKEAKDSLEDILHELDVNEAKLKGILNPDIHALFRVILDILNERLNTLQQGFSNDAVTQTPQDLGKKLDKVEKSIQTYLQDEFKRISFQDPLSYKRENLLCHTIEYCDKLSELIKKSYDLRSSIPHHFDLKKLSEIDSEMNFISLNLDKLTVELGELQESNYQYEQLLNNYNQFLLTGAHKLKSKFMTVKNLADMRIRVIQFKDFFSNFHVYRESLESLRLKVSPEVVNRLSHTHLEVIKRSDVIEKQAHDKLVELLSVLHDWLEFEKYFKELKGSLESIERSFNDSKKSDSKILSEEYLYLLESLNNHLTNNSLKVGYTLKKGKSIIERISRSEIKTDMEEFSEKWEDISLNISLAFEEEKNVCELSKNFDNSTQNLEIHMDTINEIISQIETQIQSENSVGFQNIVDRQSSVYHIKKQFFKHENLKKSVLKIGDSLLKTKRYNLTKLNRTLCFLENRWDEICDKIRDLEEMSMNPVFSSTSMEIPSAEIQSLINSFENSLDKIISETNIKNLEDAESLGNQLKNMTFKLSTIQPLIDLFCQRNTGSCADFASKKMAQKTKELYLFIDHCSEINRIMKIMSDEITKVHQWMAVQFVDTEQVVKHLFSKINVKVGVTKLKTLQEKSDHYLDYLEQAKNAFQALSIFQTSVKIDLHYISDSLISTEESLTSVRDKYLKILNATDLLLQHWKDLAKYELSIMEVEMEIDHFIGESKSLIFSTLNCVKTHATSLEVFSDRLFGSDGVYVMYDKTVASMKEDLQKNLQLSSRIITTVSLPSKSELISKIQPYFNHLTNLQFYWQQFDDLNKMANDHFVNMETIISDCYKPEYLDQIDLIAPKLNELDFMVKEVQILFTKLSGVIEYLNKILDPNTNTKMRNTQIVNNHRLYRIKKYRDSLHRKIHQLNKDADFFDIHCKRMETHTSLVFSKIPETISDRDFLDLLKDVVESRRSINEIKSISHRFNIDKTRENRFEMVITQRGLLINEILQSIQDKDIDKSAKMEFSTLCNYCMDLMRFLEPHLKYKILNNFDEVINQQITFEFLQFLIHPKESLFLILVEKGNSNDGHNCDHFQSNLKKLKIQWSNITDQINHSRMYLDKNVSTYLEFLGKLELFRFWCDNFSDRLVEFESEVWSVDEMKNLQFRLAIFNQERNAHISIYEACLATGENVFKTTIDNDTKAHIQEYLQELHEKWNDLSDRMALKSEKLKVRYNNWHDVDENMQNLFAWIQEISNFTMSDIPFYEGLNLNLQKAEMIQECIHKFMFDLKSSQPIRSELRKNVANLIYYLSPEDVTILFNRVYLIDKQCQELAIQIEIRRCEIQDRMSVWPQFIGDCRKMTLELSDVVKQLESKEGYQVDEMLTKLKSEIIPMIGEYKIRFDNLKSRGIQIQQKSGEDRSNDISYRLQKFEDLWNLANSLAENKLKELNETCDSIGRFEITTGKLKDWLMEMKERLKIPIILVDFKSDLPAKLLNEYTDLYQNIHARTGDVQSLLLLCNLLMRNPDACPNHNAKEEISKTRKKLKRRWQDINDGINLKIIQLNDLIIVWRTMETQLVETDHFINQIDDRLNSIVANIDQSPEKNLDILQVLKSDIDHYESEIQNLLINYDLMSKQDQLDNSGQIDSKVKSLKGKYETIQEEVSTLISQMEYLLSVKMELANSRDTIKSWIEDVDKQISLVDMYQPSNETKKQELCDIKQQLYEQTRLLQNIESETKLFWNNTGSNSVNFSDIFSKIKQSENVIHDISLRLRDSIRSVAKRSSRGESDSRSGTQSISRKSNQSPAVLTSSGSMDTNRKVLVSVHELNLNINDVDQFLNWINHLLNTITTDIKSIVFDNAGDMNKTFNSFVDIILTSRYKIDIVKRLSLEIEQTIKNNNLIYVKNYSGEAVKDIESKWKTTYNLCAQRDKNSKEGTGVHGQKKNLSDLGSVRSRTDYKEPFGVKQLIPMEQWISDSMIIVKQKFDLTNLSKVCKSGIRPIQSEFESLDVVLNDYEKWFCIYNAIVNSPEMSSSGVVDLSEKWRELKLMIESWITNMQHIIINSQDAQTEINRITNQIHSLKKDLQNSHSVTDDFLDQFEEVKNQYFFWKNHLEFLSSSNRHGLTLDKRLMEKMDLRMKDLIQLNRLINRISNMIVESHTPNVHIRGFKRPHSIHFEDDGETTAPTPTSASFSNDDDDDDDVASNSSLLVPSISSFEQPYVQENYVDVISDEINIYLRSTRPAEYPKSSISDIIISNSETKRLAQGDHSSPVIDNLSTSASWSQQICRTLLLSIPIVAILIILFLILIFLLQPECESSWQCSSPLSGVSVKKHWPKSAAI